MTILTEAELLGIEKGAGSWIEHGTRVYPLSVVSRLLASHREVQSRREVMLNERATVDPAKAADVAPASSGPNIQEGAD